MEWLKKAVKTTEANSQEAREAVASMLQKIRAGGEPAVRELARKFDKWNANFILSPRFGPGKRQAGYPVRS